MKFYTNIKRRGDKLYIRGYEDGRLYKEIVDCRPYLFTKVDGDSDYHTIHGEPLCRLDFESPKEAYEYIKKYENVGNHKLYGMKNYEYVYLYDNFKENFEYDYSLLNVISLDIETDSSNGFPNIDEADKEITAITLVRRGKSITFAYGEYPKGTEDHIYVKCRDEKELLARFIQIWNVRKWHPDIVTGWNIEFFDIPYLVNRIKRILSIRDAEKLSPFGFINQKEVTWNNNKTFKTYEIVGIASIDYLAAYRKFKPAQVESYKLDFIAELEIKERKLDFSPHKNLDELYRNDFIKYIDYNIHDALLVERLEEKLHFIEQMVSTAYVQRVNFEDTITTVRPWDVLIHNDLMDNGIVVPPNIPSQDNYIVPGGYVKEPIPGKYRYVASVDFTSLYPSLAMQYNISPDTFVQKLDFIPSMEDLMFGDISEFTQELIDRNLCMTANGCLFKREKRGFFPRILKKYFEGRKVYKKLMIEKKKEFEKFPDNTALENEYSKYNNLQTAYKLIGNSGYGAFLNKYFRWFDSNLGEGITLSGQMTTQYISIRVNEHMNKILKTVDQDYVIYCDTDSAYISLDLVSKKIGAEGDKLLKALIKFMETNIVPFINQACKELAARFNVFEVTTEVKLEKICDNAIFVAKKRYILNALYDEGVFIDHPKPKVTGLETVRSNVPKVAREALKKTYEIMINQTQEDLYKFIAKFKEDFMNFKIEEIGTPTSVNGISDYYDPITLYRKGTPAHVKASIIYNKMIKSMNLLNKYQPILDHDKIKWVILKTPNPFKNDAIAIKDEEAKELNIPRYIDYEAQFEKVFLKPLRGVTTAIGWNVEKVFTLEDFFG